MGKLQRSFLDPRPSILLLEPHYAGLVGSNKSLFLTLQLNSTKNTFFARLCFMAYPNGTGLQQRETTNYPLLFIVRLYSFTAYAPPPTR